MESILGKRIGPENDYAESWEVVDHGREQSVVRNGPRAYTALTTLIAQCNRELFGKHAPQTQFPLLLKLLDCHQNLSVQVHPNDAQAAQCSPPDRGKTEAWVVLHAEPDSWIYAGLKYPLERAQLAARIAAGDTVECLHRFQPQVGDCVFIPAGTVHALGAGLIVAEIQQASDTTFRLYDWDRRGLGGSPRPLHVDQALDVIDYQAGPVAPFRSKIPATATSEYIERLVSCEHFVIERRQFDQTTQIGGDQRFHLLIVLDGSLEVPSPHIRSALTPGQVVLLPAEIGALELATQAKNTTILDVFLP